MSLNTISIFLKLPLLDSGHSQMQSVLHNPIRGNSLQGNEIQEPCHSKLSNGLTNLFQPLSHSNLNPQRVAAAQLPAFLVISPSGCLDSNCPHRGHVILHVPPFTLLPKVLSILNFSSSFTSLVNSYLRVQPFSPLSSGFLYTVYTPLLAELFAYLPLDHPLPPVLGTSSF